MQLLAFLIAVSAAPAISDRLDEGLTNFEGLQPIFVRMDRQLFKQAGDFEEFCKAHERESRFDTRKMTLNTLHDNADRSWQAIHEFVQKQEASGDVKNLKRFWIVNGFACDADMEACKALAMRDDVSFVYLQRGPQGLVQNPPHTDSPAFDDEHKKAMEEALTSAISDTDEPFTTKGLDIPWDVKQIQADQVWEKEGVTGSGVIVAVNDAGIYDIPALRPALWRNPKEELNGKDDDGNGYADDLFGWDASAESGAVLGNTGVMHGTTCSAIIAGRPTKEKNLVTGVAPRARLMVANGMGTLESIEYALSNGADVFSMSYMFVNMELGNYRGVFRLAAEDATAAGMLLCGGAGNFATNAPEGRQITLPKDIPCVLAVAGTYEDESRPPFSSKGPVTWGDVKFYSDYPDSKPLSKPDVSAPAGGFLCWSVEGDSRPKWETVFKGAANDILLKGPQGNSFAGPHAAGVAALLFSANREIQPWQVKSILEETAKDLGPAGRDYLHGAGLIQALEAVRKAKALISDR